MHSEYYQDNDFKGSLNDFEESLKQNESKYFEIHEFEFIIDHYISSNNISKSKAALHNALKIHPKNHELQKRIAQINNIEGLHKAAIHTINNSFRAFGTEKDIDYYLILGEAYLGTGNLEKTKHLFEKAVDISEDEYFEVVTTVAALFQQEGHYKEALSYLTKVEHEDTALLFDIALAYQNLSKHTEAILYFQKFIPTSVFSVDAWYYISCSYRANENFKKAENAILNAIAIEPEILIYQYDLAKIYIDQVKYLEALELYKEILSKDKDVNHTIFLSIGDISYNLEQYENARKNYEIALRLNPNSSESFYSLGLVEIEVQDYSKAKIYIQKAIALNPERAEFFMSLGTVNQILNDNVNAEFLFIEAVKLASHTEDTWGMLIDFYYLNDNPEKAIETINHAEEKLGFETLLLIKKAAANFDLGERKKALDLLKAALNINKNESNTFLEYYPEGKTDPEILNLINNY